MALKYIPQRFLKLYCLLLAGLLFLGPLGCQTKKSDSSPQSPNQTTEMDYVSSPTTYTGSVTLVSGTASFARYDDGASGLSSITTGNPIRYAEFWVYDASNNRIQQGETSSAGLVSFTIPNTAGTYTIAINSRADNAFLKASVLKDPYSNSFYQLTSSFTIAQGDSTKNISISQAEATNSSDLLGGAFNILDMIYIGNKFLRDQSTDALCSVCTAFTVAPKVQVYWQKGISPGVYYNSPGTGISYFAPSTGGGIYKGLYILGGIQGDVCADTDHFDKSIILHEYGHFLESAFGKSASPGGAHNGSSIIDPRLAWSEGWADFYQGVALGRSYYRDTIRNSACSSGAGLAFADFSLETKLQDIPLPNEGIFREFAIARNLFELSTGASQAVAYNLNLDTDSYATDIGFSTVWHSFKALNSVTYKFQNAGLFNEVFSALTSGSPYSNTQRTNLTNALNHERQSANQNLYGLPLKTNGTAATGACLFSITALDPSADTVSAGVVTYTDQLRSNDFFRFDFDGTSNTSVVKLKYSASVGNPYDLDVRVFKETYDIYDTSDIVLTSSGTYPESSSPPGLETINFTGQAAGTYMINVKVKYTGAKATTNYYLENGQGVQLCP